MTGAPYEIHFTDGKRGDREERRQAFVGNRIVKSRLQPRRVWDLYSNRVVPYWITASYQSRLISHPWMDEQDRTTVWTTINGYEWPVPIPKDVDLNLIRIEMLNLGLEYVWLDVLCLRQAGDGGRTCAPRSGSWMCPPSEKCIKAHCGVLLEWAGSAFDVEGG